MLADTCFVVGHIFGQPFAIGCLTLGVAAAVVAIALTAAIVAFCAGIKA